MAPRALLTTETHEDQHSPQMTTLLQITLALHAGMWFSSMQRANKKLSASPICIHDVQELRT